MLILSRKPGQAIQIGNVTVTVKKIGSRVVLAIEAPPSVKIVRAELKERAA